MKDPALKTAAAVCVLLGGLCAATLFRHDRPKAGPPGADARDELLLRYRGANDGLNDGLGAQLRAADRSTTSEPNPPPTPARPRPVTIVTPEDRHEPPPSLAPGYPEHESPVKARWGVSMDMMLPVAKPAEDAHSHTVVDGDTLAALAERYLGSAARAEEIYQANRDILHDPRLLPIGVELKLPPRKSQAAPATTPSSKTAPQAALVPVR
jgi:nucleoid-associated protein YgaU